MAKTFPIEIMTPYRLYLRMEVEEAEVKADNGYLGILAGHTPLIAPVAISDLMLKNGDTAEHYAIGGGLLHVENDKVTLLVDSIEKASEIDLERAMNAKKRAEDRLSSKSPDIDVRRAEMALSRALNRISVKNQNNS